jgi:hypothetical protein
LAIGFLEPSPVKQAVPKSDLGQSPRIETAYLILFGNEITCAEPSDNATANINENIDVLAIPLMIARKNDVG